MEDFINTDKFIHAEDYWKWRFDQEEVKRCKAETQLAMEAVQSSNKDLELLKFKILEQKRRVQAKQHEYQLSAEKYKKNKEELENTFDLVGKDWLINDETLEIVLEDKDKS